MGAHAEPASPPGARDRIPLATAVAFALPRLAYGYLVILVLIYLMKFSTDVLLLQPAVIGLIFGLSRLWDAVSDPIAGYLSDRTRSRFGRRRPWLVLAIVPAGLFNIMAWSPPAALEGGALALWMGVAIFGLYTGLTMIAVPHASLGAELSRDYAERNRIFGYSHLGFALGTFLAPLALWVLVNAEDPRAAARGVAWAGSGLMALLVALAVTRLPERPEHAGRGPSNPFTAVADVWRNPHARIVLCVYFIEHIGSGAMAVLAPYVLEYVVGRPGLLPWVLPFYSVATVLSIPLWIRLGRRYGKKELWLSAMLLHTLAYGSFVFVGLVPLAVLAAFAAVAGVAGGCASIIAPSIKADVIDWDELRTGERKEGSYYAAWNFAQKSAGGVVAMLAGFCLQLVGFEPNVEQSEATKLAIRGLMGLLPFVFYAGGIAIFWRFRLDRAEHARIRAALDAVPRG